MQDAGGGGGAIAAGAAVGAVMGGPAGAAASIGASMAKFASTAAAGGFEVSEEGGRALISTITAFQQFLLQNADKVDTISQEPQLGRSNGANEMKPFTQQVATDPQGFATQLKALRESLEQAKQGIIKAMENYRETDAANQAAIRHSGGNIAV
jgi:hypothetical protein